MNNHFAAFAVVITDDNMIWATTRDGIDAGKIGLPGGKSEPGETNIETARREAFEEGLIVSGAGELIHTDYWNCYLIHWVKFDSAVPMSVDYKEKHRGITPILVSRNAIANSGYGNEFLRG